mgnify:CR=1 FL=1
MLRLYVKDNTSGRVHEYGTNQHDALILQNDGSLHYENLQCCAGTMFPEDGYSFCNEDGTIPKWDKEYGAEPYIDIGGEYYNKPTTNADRIRSMTDEELAWELMLWRCEAVARHHGISSVYPDTQKTILEWLQQPAEQKSLKKIKKKC